MSLIIRTPDEDMAGAAACAVLFDDSRNDGLQRRAEVSKMIAARSVSTRHPWLRCLALEWYGPVR
jgi:hypothetical protein